jgi:lysophosphatidylcholine acyltransferase/lyso-PAF acetyltransferase
MLFCFGFISIEVIGRVPFPCPPIVVSNHISTIEILHLATILNTPAFVTKSAVFNIPIIGRVARDILQCIGVDRTGTTNTTERITQRIRSAKAVATIPTIPLVIFPEGTTSNGTQLLSFKKGAFVSRQPVLPIVYSFPRSGSFIPTYESIMTPIYVWRIMSQPWNNLQCKILDPISPDRNDQTIAEYAVQVRNVMAKSLDVDVIDMDYSDKLKYHDQLRAAYSAHPRGGLWAMCFDPMLCDDKNK